MSLALVLQRSPIGGYHVQSSLHTRVKRVLPPADTVDLHAVSAGLDPINKENVRPGLDVYLRLNMSNEL